jgi:hypothetical protein
MQSTIQALATSHYSLTTTPLMGGLYVARQETRDHRRETRCPSPQSGLVPWAGDGGRKRAQRRRALAACHDVLEKKDT